MDHFRTKKKNKKPKTGVLSHGSVKLSDQKNHQNKMTSIKMAATSALPAIVQK